MPKISVVMPVYNSEKYLDEAIESVLNQTYKDFEFLIIYDESSDKTLEILEKYQKQDERIKIIQGKNEGIAGALNLGLDLSTGKYIARMDSDNISLPERFEKQVKYLEEHPEVSILGTSYEKFPKNKVVVHPKKVDYITLLKGCYVAHPAVMIKKTDLDRYNLRYKANIPCEDYKLWSRAIRFLKIENLEEVLLKYRWDCNNISIKKSEELNRASKEIQQDMLDFLTNDEKLKNKLEIIIWSDNKNSFLQNIFSVKNSLNRKIITILGIKFSVKRQIK